MNEDIRADLKAHIDGELDADRAQAVRAALESDATLRAEAEFMRTLTKSFASLRPRAEATAEMAEAAAARLVRRPRTLLRSPWVWSGAAAMLLIAVFARPVWDVAKSEGFDEASESKRMAPELLRDSPSEGTRDHESPAIEAPDERRRSDALDSAAPRPDSAAATRERRDIILNGDLTVRANSVLAAEKQAIEAVTSWGGYVQSISRSNTSTPAPRVELIVRVPVPHFDSAVSRLGSLGERVAGSSSKDDVTEQLRALDAQIHSLKVQEQSNAQFGIQGGSGTNEAELQNRLSSLRAEVQRLESRSAQLREQSSLATVRLVLTQR